MDNVPTILIVEDNMRHSRLLRDYLQHHRYDTIEVTNIEDAQREVEKFQGLLIVLIDIEIPETSASREVLYRGGLELEERLREFNEEIPAIFVTVYGDAYDVIEVAKDQGREVVAKPLDFQELLNKIKAVSLK